MKFNIITTLAVLATAIATTSPLPQDAGPPGPPTYHVKACCATDLPFKDTTLRANGTTYFGITPSPHDQRLDRLVRFIPSANFSDNHGTIEVTLQEGTSGPNTLLLALLGDPNGPEGASIGYVPAQIRAGGFGGWAPIGVAPNAQVDFTQWWLIEKNGTKYLRYGSKDTTDACWGFRFVPASVGNTERWITVWKTNNDSSLQPSTCANITITDFELVHI